MGRFEWDASLHIRIVATRSASSAPAKRPRASGARTKKAADPEMRPEYDLTGAVRGKYAGRFTDATKVEVVESDGSRNTRTLGEVKRDLLKRSR